MIQGVRFTVNEDWAFGASQRANDPETKVAALAGGNMVRTIEWIEGPRPFVRLLDQTRLPQAEVYREVAHVEQMWQAIRELAVRGAPAIGIAAAYGVALAARQAAQRDGDALDAIHFAAEAACERLATSRPTAVNLFWALERMRHVLARGESDADELVRALAREAHSIHEEDRQRCAAIGRHGAELIPDGGNVLTHCNTGCLATGGIGTAIGVLMTAWHELGRRFRVFACETRPLLQGARLTTWELMRQDIDVTLLCDGAAAHAMRTQGVAAVIVGADRVAANGDVANKIGTYNHAVLAKHHGVPFYVAAPLSTFDRKILHGGTIPIEERDADEVRTLHGQPLAPPHVPCYAPAFDVTPAELVTGLITDVGILRPPYAASIAEAFGATNA